MRQPEHTKNRALRGLQAFAALGAACALTLQASPIITSVVETGGDNEATDTIAAQWTGETFVSGVAGEPITGSAATDAYTVGMFQSGAPAFVDRNHAYLDDVPNSLPVPAYLLDGEYIMSGNDNRDNDPYVLDVTVSKDVICYMLIDNRTGGNGNGNPPTIGPGTGFMEWIDGTWTPVIQAGNHYGDAAQPDEVAIDEGADGGINQWYSIYSKIFPAGTFQLLQANNAGQNMYGAVIKEVPSAPQMGPVVGSPVSFSAYILDLGGLTIDVPSIAVELDGAAVTVTKSKTGARTDINYDLFTAKNEFFAAGSTHDVTVTAKDNLGADYTFEGSFTVADYATVPPEWKVAAATDAGMNIDVYQTTEAAAPAQNTLATTEQWWARGLPGGGAPAWENVYSDWYLEFTEGVQVVNMVADHTLYAGDINATPAGGPDNFNSARPAANPQANNWVPGIPGNTASYENYVVEVTTYLQLSRGMVRMGVNSDDGFRVSVAPGQPSVTGLTLGLYNAGRGASDTTFDFVVEENGYYAMRLLYWQGGGGASCEWFTVNPATGEKILVNGPGASVKAYKNANDRARVAQMLPANGFTGTDPDVTVTIQIENGSTSFQTGSAKLMIDGAEVTPNVSTSGSTTTVSYKPQLQFAYGQNVAGSLMWTETTATPTEWTEDFTFTVRGLDITKDPAVLLSGPPAQMLGDKVVLMWTISKYATQLNPASLQILVDGVNATAEAVVTEDAAQSYVTIDYTGTQFANGPHTWSFKWSDTGTKTETVTGAFEAVGEKPPINANIAWVSFHPADDTPSAAAVTDGFTQAPDVGYTQLLEANGHTVTRVVTSGNPDVDYLNTFDLVMISRSVPSGDYQDPPETLAWNGVRAPTIIMGGYILRNSRLGYTTGATIPDTTGSVKLKVNAPGHPIFDGVSLDGSGLMVNTYADLMTFNDIVQRGISVNTDPVSPGGVVLATLGTEGDPALGGMVIGEWQAGASMSNGAADVLGGHRLVLLTGSREQTISSQGAGIYDLTADGAKLLLNAVQYMAAPPPAPARNIAFVSFHPADDTPAGDAATAGFTEAPDVGYTRLLTDNGHTVTRILTSGTPDVKALNRYDLVIISRSAPSGDYQQSEKTALWNGISQPVILLNGYLVRSSRLGFTSGTTMVDAAGPINLKVEALTHPIFEGIALDGQNLTTDTYADLVNFNDTVQRGISVNMDPVVDGGTVLATVGTEADPTATGMIIGEFPAGTQVGAGRDVLAGERMILLTGSREASGLTSQGAGIYDLSPMGAQLLLNAVNYMAKTPPPMLTIGLDAGNVVIGWEGEGTLQEADVVTGPFTDVAGATNPFSTPADGSEKYYRLMQ